MGQQDFQQVCLNGHQITDRYNNSPEFRKDFCPTCGANTIHKCPNCDAKIKGGYEVEGVTVLSLSTTPIPTHCDSCGSPFPWAQKVKKRQKKENKNSPNDSKIIFKIPGFEFHGPAKIAIIILVLLVVSYFFTNWTRIKNNFLQTSMAPIVQTEEISKENVPGITEKNQEESPKIKQIAYSFSDLETKGFHHIAPVFNSPRFCNNTCQIKATSICKALGHTVSISFEVRDEGRAIHSLVCK